MNIQYELEKPFTYSWNLVIIMIIIIVILVFLYVLIKLKPFFYKKMSSVVNKSKIPSLKERYIKKLQKLLQLVNKNKINNREAYTRLSVLIREFIEKTTGINVLSLSKSEIKKMDIKELSLLMEEYYPPEFAKDINGDIVSSINKTIEVIRRWN